MPTYSYKCTQCEKVFDSFHSMSCTDSQHCPECNGVGKKLMSASSVIFKGSGFYSTDYRDSGYLEAKKKDSNTESSDSSSKKTDTKPAAESEKSSTSKPEKKSESSDTGKKAESQVPKAA